MAQVSVQKLVAKSPITSHSSIKCIVCNGPNIQPSQYHIKMLQAHSSNCLNLGTLPHLLASDLLQIYHKVNIHNSELIAINNKFFWHF